jgi:hypothetical protein
MGNVSNAELETFAKIIMQTKAYQKGKVDLAGLLNIYINHITSESLFDVRFDAALSLFRVELRKNKSINSGCGFGLHIAK